MQSKLMWCAGMIAAVGLSAGVATAEDDERFERMQSRIDDLEREVRGLRASLDGEDWLTETRAAEITTLVQEVLADADTRAGLMSSQITAGHDTAFFIGSSDGNFLLRIGGRIQPRFVYNHQNGSPDVDTNGDGMPDAGSGDDDRWGFEVRRLKLDLWGHVVDPSWTFKVQIAAGNADAELDENDAYFEKELAGGWRVRGGQYKPPFMREELVSSRFQLAAERSLVNHQFSQGGRSIGIELANYGEQLSARLMLNNGLGNANVAALDYDTEIGVTGRVEYLARGTWRQFDDFTSWSGDELGVLIGAAFNYERQEYGTSAPGGVDDEEEVLSVTGDLSLEFGGSNIFVSGVYRRVDGATTADQYGIVVQGGVFVVPDLWEVFARWEYGDLDMDVADLNVLTVGFNRYFAGQALKWTFDVGYGFDGLAPDFAATTSAGWREDAPGQDGQVVVRSQFQLLF